jgi:hypothetical protein
MDDAILTIAIPTFNENSKLDLQLSRLLEQCENLPIKIKVFDNNPFSDFNYKKYPLNSFLYVKNPYNLGADWNIFSCFLNCETEYVWILSTNDLIKDDCISNIVMTINNAQKNECCFIHLGQSKQFYTKGIQEFINQINYEDSFTISRCLYNVNKLKRNFADYNKVVNSNQGQIYLIFAFLIENPLEKCLFTNYDPIQNYLPSEWSKEKFIKNTLNLVLIYAKLFSKHQFLLNLMKNKIQKMLFFQLFISRSYQKLSLINFIYFFIKIALLNRKTIYKSNISIFLRSMFDYKYYMKLRKINWGIKNEDDFKFN